METIAKRLDPSALSLPAPAKINRFLHIIGQREDGYHLLQTLFQFLDYADQLHFALRQDNLIVVKPDNLFGISQHNNLVYRAAHTLQRSANIAQGVTVTIEKKIPLGGGLGGGSSNAATTLLALNWLWELNWPLSQLAPLALQLGADVPVFLHGHTAWGEGIGEKLTPVALNESWILVITPNCQVSSAKMYGKADLTRHTSAFKIGALAKDEIEPSLSHCRNDFELLVRRYYKAVDNAITWLSNFCEPRLSGSGASVFACFSSFAQAKEVVQCVPSCFKGFVAKGMNISPLFVTAEKLGLKFNDWGVAKR